MKELDQAVEAFEAADATYRAAHRAEQEHEAQRATVKLTAIRELLAAENPVTGKPFTVTDAKDYVSTNPQYANYLKHGRTLTDATLEAEARREVTLVRLRHAFQAEEVAA